MSETERSLKARSPNAIFDEHRRPSSNTSTECQEHTIHTEETTILTVKPNGSTGGIKRLYLTLFHKSALDINF